MGKGKGTYVSETRSSVSEPAIDLSHIQYAYFLYNDFKSMITGYIFTFQYLYSATLHKL